MRVLKSFIFLKRKKTILMNEKFEKNDIGQVETQEFIFDEIKLKSGVKFGPITLAFETYGTLNEEKSNAVLIAHALSGDAHAAGWHEGDKKPGWWNGMIGPGKAFDTDKYFVICSNVIGGCKGSTGPTFIDPKTKKQYGLSFPVITIEDMVVCQKKLIDHLDIEKLLCVAGGSMGGQQTLAWSIMYPDAVNACISIATSTKHTAQQIAFQEVARQAIMSDPDWQGGDYYGKNAPARGLAVARMVGHITYMSEQSMEKKFGRKLNKKETLGYDFTQDFEVENYLNYRGSSFVERFDANSYLYISKALDYFDLAQGKSLIECFSTVKAKFLIISFNSDWLYPTHQNKAIAKALIANGSDVSNIEINASYGHDSFLVEIEGQSKLISHFLRRITKEIHNGKK